MLAQALVLARDLQLVGDAGALLRDPPIAAIPGGCMKLAIKNLQPNIRGMLADAEAMQGITVSPREQVALSSASVKYGNETLVEVKRPDVLAKLQSQLRLVLSYADLRGERASEILSQVVPQIPLWSGIAGLQPDRHKYTYELLGVALRFSNVVVQQMKLLLNFPRPIEVSPLVLPMVLTPGHSSFPMGHAAEGYCAVEVLSGVAYNQNSDWELPIGASRGGSSGIHHAGGLRRQLLRAAYRVSENRVVAGLHYPMDTLAGQLLGIYMAHYLLWRASSKPQQDQSTLIATESTPVAHKPKATYRLYGNALFELASGDAEPTLDQPLLADKNSDPCPKTCAPTVPSSPVLSWLFENAVAEWKR
jgi:hypothetical protein